MLVFGRKENERVAQVLIGDRVRPRARAAQYGRVRVLEQEFGILEFFGELDDLMVGVYELGYGEDTLAVQVEGIGVELVQR